MGKVIKIKLIVKVEQQAIIVDSWLCPLCKETNVSLALIHDGNELTCSYCQAVVIAEI